MKTKPLFSSKWIRLHSDTLEELQKEFEKAYDGESSKEYQWFVQRMDYQEMCRRSSPFTTKKDKLRELLLKIVERLT